MALLSKDKNGEVTFGEYIEATDYCKRNCNNDRCRMVHETAQEGMFSMCPNGMTIYRACDTVFFSLRVKGYYKKGKSNENDNCYNPVHQENKMLQLIREDSHYDELKKAEELKDESEKRFRHEIKNLNSQMKDLSEDILVATTDDNNGEYKISSEQIKKIVDKIRTINVCSSMVMSRYTLNDYEKHPEVLYGGQFECNVYKKFDKISKILRNYEKKGVKIEIKGNSYLRINAYPSFEFIPLLVLENAIKYSYNGGNVQVEFIEREFDPDDKLSIVVSSYGPVCSRAELTRIFEKGFRGINAKNKADGSGIGLYFVKILCDLHRIGVSANSYEDRFVNLSGIKYAPFEIKLDFSDVF